MNIDNENANPAKSAFFLLLDASIVEIRIISTANAHGFIASTIAADKTAGIVNFVKKDDFNPNVRVLLYRYI